MLVSFDAETEYKRGDFFRNFPSLVGTASCETGASVCKEPTVVVNFPVALPGATASPHQSPVRIIVVEDFQPFRSFICSTFSKTPELHVICEASDGLEAVRQAEELHPDLILLDIGLPSLNGIEAARRIRKVSSKSKIIFVSQESSADVAQEAFSSGAMGYVVKAHAGSELLAAVDAVRRGSQFISSGLSGHYSTDASDSKALDRLCRKEALPSRSH
jgi:DNA-binding NarL/FixJ family response regulator